MSLSYKNYSKDEILKQSRNIDYASGLPIYNGFLNNVEMVSYLKIDLVQIKQQADIFAKQMLIHRSKIDFKRFLGSRDDRWKKLLHETYVYDRCRSIYYGLNSIFISKFPSETHSFVGNVLLANLLKDNTKKFGTNDQLPYDLFFRVEIDRRAEELLEPVFKVYPNLKKGLSNFPNSYTYISSEHESYLTGLYNAKLTLERNTTNRNSNSETNNIRPSIYDMCTLDSDTVLPFFSDEQYPFMNSFLSEDSSKFGFILPSDQSKPEIIKFNESVFLARAIGLVSKGVQRQENNLYCMVPRRFSSDNLIFNEVYSITGLKTEILPDSDEFINGYIITPPIKDNLLSYDGGNEPTP